MTDSMTIIVEYKEDLKYILKIMERKLNMRIKAMKTKILVCSKENNIRTRINLRGNQILEHVYLRYLGSSTSSDRRCKKEIMNKICEAKVTYWHLTRKEVFLPQEILDFTRRKIYVWSIVLYGSELSNSLDLD